MSAEAITIESQAPNIDGARAEDRRRGVLQAAILLLPACRLEEARTAVLALLDPEVRELVQRLDLDKQRA